LRGLERKTRKTRRGLGRRDWMTAGLVQHHPLRRREVGGGREAGVGSTTVVRQSPTRHLLCTGHVERGSPTYCCKHLRLAYLPEQQQVLCGVHVKSAIPIASCPLSPADFRWLSRETRSSPRTCLLPRCLQQ
jgi:hypothetical protein